jgi:hypothetical protein
MKVAKKIVSLIVSLLLVMMISPTLVRAADERIIVYAQVPDEWSAPCVWAWADDGTNAFDAWPGEPMKADDNNPGWYYCWIPATAGNVIINANNGEVQTADQKLEAKNAWVTITDADHVDISYEAQTTGNIPEYVETFKVHAKTDESWEDVHIWAWLDPDGTNAFDAWPGEAMTQGDNDWYTADVPVWVNRVIINGNGGDVQTEDLSIDAAEVWITVEADGKADFTYDDPDAPVVEDITVYVQAPSDWSEPHLWAWSAPDGTNAFSAWPGEALQDDGDGWYSMTVPGWVNSLIVNGNNGEIQTADLSIDTGKDVWVQVQDADNAEVYYEEPEAMAPASTEASESAETISAEIAAADTAVTAATVADTEPAVEEKSADKGVNPAVPIVGVAAAAAVIAGVAVSKKKKS